MLIENLIIESIQIYGHEIIYVPRFVGAIDKLFGEDPLREYTRAIPIEMFIKNIEGFAGEGDFLSKFNIQIRDQITFSVARRTFASEIGTEVLESMRPREGDLIYFPLNRKIFEIKFVEHEAIFYQLGALQMYDLKCELFEYNNEYFNTGIGDIDALMNNYTLSANAFGLLTETLITLADEEEYSIVMENIDINENDPIASNDEIETIADGFVDFTETDPFSEGAY